MEWSGKRNIIFPDDYDIMFVLIMGEEGFLSAQRCKALHPNIDCWLIQFIGSTKTHDIENVNNR